jgi:hypothetical protein
MLIYFLSQAVSDWVVTPHSIVVDISEEVDVFIKLLVYRDNVITSSHVLVPSLELDCIT